MSNCDPLLARVKQIGGIVESTCGEGGSFISADFGLRISSLNAAVSMAPIEDDTLSATLSPRKLAMGEKTIQVQVAGKLVGSGVAATKPEHDVYLRACGYASVVAQSAAIGAVTGGPFAAGETITQATSLATGMVVRTCINGDAKLYFTVLSGAFNGTDVITGSSSGATATPSAVPAAAGFAYHPVTNSQETAAFRIEEDGKYKLCYGAMGNFTINAESSGPATIEYTLNGKFAGHGDAALTSGVTTFTTAYPTLLDARAYMDAGLSTEFLPVVRSVAFDNQGQAVVRKDANDTTGLIAAQVTGRTPQITLTAESSLNADYDVLEKMADSDSVSIGFGFNAPDNKVYIFGVNGQITDAPEGDADGFMTNDLQFRMNGVNGDDELWIAFLV